MYSHRIRQQASTRTMNSGFADCHFRGEGNALLWNWFTLVLLVLICICLSSCGSSRCRKGYPSGDFIVEPPLDLGEIRRVGSVYGTPAASPDSLGGIHNGIDIGADENARFVASVPGMIVNIIEGHDFHSETTDVILRYNREFSVIYTFEPAKRIKVKKYRCVKRGDTIGYLGRREAGYIDQCVHFGVKRDDRWICPIPYLAEDFRERLNRVYQSLEGRDPRNICNCPEHQFYFE